MIVFGSTLIGMLIALLLLRRVARQPGNGMRKKLSSFALFAVILALCGAAFWQMRHTLGWSGGENFALGKAQTMAQAQGWGIGNHLVERFPAGVVAVIADLDGNAGFAADFETGLRAAGVKEWRLVNLTVPESNAGRPKFMVMTHRDFNRATDTVPDAVAVVSLVGLPGGSLKAVQKKQPLLVAQTGGAPERLQAELRTGALAALVVGNPELARAETPDYPEELPAAFRHFFVLQQP